METADTVEPMLCLVSVFECVDIGTWAIQCASYVIWDGSTDFTFFTGRKGRTVFKADGYFVVHCLCKCDVMETLNIYFLINTSLAEILLDAVVESDTVFSVDIAKGRTPEMGCMIKHSPSTSQANDV